VCFLSFFWSVFEFFKQMTDFHGTYNEFVPFVEIHNAYKPFLIFYTIDNNMKDERNFQPQASLMQITLGF